MATSHHTAQFNDPLVDARLSPLPPLDANAYRMICEREESAYARGRQHAENSFSQQLVSQRNEMLETQNGVLTAVRSAIPNVIRETEQMLVDLAVATAERLVAGMTVDSAMVEAAIREALTQVEDGSSVRVQLHADDLALLKKEGSEILEDDGDTGALAVEVSSEVSRGGCILRTRFGDIDARREIKIEQVKQALEE